MKKFKILICFLIIACGLTAQNLNSPFIKSVSYNESDGKYIISWDTLTQTGVVDHYALYVFAGYSGTNPQYKFIKGKDNISTQLAPIEIDSIFTTVDNTISDTLDRQVCYFAIEAFSKGNTAHSSNNISQDPKNGNVPCNVLLQGAFNLCSEQLQLKWNTLKNWVAYGISYKYNTGSNWENWSFNGGKIITSDLYNLTKDTIYNKNYKTDTDVYVQIIAYDNVPNYWYSNIIKANTRTIPGPSYINADGTDASSNDSIELNFSIDPTSKLNRYRLLKAVSDSNKFKPIATIVDTSFSYSVHYFDNDVKTASENYYYKLVALNNCDTPKLTSNIESNIGLLYVLQSGEVVLKWNSYVQFAGNLKQYDIHRKLNLKNDSVIGSILPVPALSYPDDLHNLGVHSVSEEIWYYIEAIEDSTTNPNNHHNGDAKSNILQITVQDSLNLDKFFTPNNDGKNDVFPNPLKAFTFPPTKYQLIIYDRWGTNVFETTNYTEGWNGRYSGGGAATQGVYLYYIKITGSDGISKEYKGTITLLLP